MTRTAIENEELQLAEELKAWTDEDVSNSERRNRSIASARMMESFNRRIHFEDAEIFDFLNFLDLGNLHLTSVPPAIGRLVTVDSLNLSGNNLSELPAEIENIRGLRQLLLASNQFQRFPSEVLGLENLTQLFINENQIESIDERIGSLRKLRILDVSDNLISTIPDSMFYRRENDEMFKLNLVRNRIDETEAQRLGRLCGQNRIFSEITIYDSGSRRAPTSQEEVISPIIDSAEINEEKSTNERFLSSENLKVFRKFLDECTRTAGWSDSEQLMSKSLNELVAKMREDEHLTAKCLAIADTAFETCGDRVSLAYVQMMVAKDILQKPVAEMAVDELFEYSRKESVVKFLSEKAEAKIAQIKRDGGLLDEIETHLAYLQAASNLGLEIPSSQMIYRGCSGVSDEDLENAVTEFGDPITRAAKHAYNDRLLREHPAIIKIIIRATEDLDLSPQKGETDKQFEERMSSAEESFGARIIDAIKENFINSKPASRPSPFASASLSEQKGALSRSGA